MLTVANLDRMAKSTTRRAGALKPAWGRKIAARRTELGLSLAAVEDATDGVVYSQLLYRLENGRMNPDNVKAHQLEALLRVLEWTLADWNALPGRPREVQGEHRHAPEHRDARDEVQLDPAVTVGRRSIEVYDILSAGPGGDGGTVIEVIDIPDTWRGEHAAYEVSGNSMSPDIEDGDRVVVKLQDYASPGNEIVCYVPDHGMLVKYLERTTSDGQYVLTSYNPEYRPIWTTEITIYGVVVEVRKRRKVVNGNHGAN